MAGSPTEDIYTFDDSVVDISGDKYNVAGFELVLQHNAIPELRVVIDPMHVHKAPEMPAELASVYNFVDTYKKLQEKIESKTDRSTKFEWSCKATGDGDDQKLNLDGWLLIGAGFEGLGSNGELRLALEIRHPAWKITESSINFFGYGGAPKPSKEAVPPADLLTGIKDVLKLYYEDAETALVIPLAGDTDYKDTVERFKELLVALDEHFKWESEGSGWPDAPFIGTEIAKEVPYGLWAYIWGQESITPWNWLSNIFSDFSANLIPTFWDAKLQISPYTPWAKADMTLFETDVESFVLPPKDPMPLCGVYVLLDENQLPGYTSADYKEGMEQVDKDAAIHMEQKLRGALQPRALPVWARSMLDSRSAEWGSASYPGDNLRYNSPINSGHSEEGAGAVDPQDLIAVFDGTKIIAKQMFTESYRRHYEISAVCRLMLQHDQSPWPEKYVIPGSVFAFTNAEEPWLVYDASTGTAAPSATDFPPADKTLLKFFATHIIHTVDCDRHIASTQIRGGYLRRENGPTIESIIAGIAPNYLYDSSSGGGAAGGGAAGGTP